MSGVQQFDESFPILTHARIQNADGLNQVTLVPTSTVRQRIDAIALVSTDTIDHIVVIALNDGSLALPLGSVSVPAGTGITVPGNVQAISLLLPTNQLAVTLPPGWSLSFGALATVTGSNALFAVAVGGQI